MALNEAYISMTHHDSLFETKIPVLVVELLLFLLTILLTILLNLALVDFLS